VSVPTSPSAAHDRAMSSALLAARTAAENRGRDVVVLDTRDQTALFDFFVIATGSSRRQLHAMSDEIERRLREELGERRIGQEGYQESRWVVLDYGDIVVHLFDEDARHYYDLENLWAEGNRVDLTATLAGV
jgi:ribosome-associated protein